jgi:hypothetical protein
MTNVTTREAVLGTGHGLRTTEGAIVNELANSAITAVAMAGDDLWVLVNRTQLFRVSDGHATQVTALDDGTGRCLGVHRNTVWVGGADASLWRLDGDRVVRAESFDHAPTHDEWHTPWGGPPDVYSITSDGTDMYVSVHVGGILRSPDGESWSATIDLHDDVHQVVVGPDGTLWAATGMRGLAESHDQGRTWRYHTAGLHASYALTAAAVTDGALVAVSSGHAGRDGAVYRLEGDRLERVAGLPTAMHGAVGPRQLAAAGDAAVVALPNGDVYASDDAGLSWLRIAEGLPNVTEILIRDR